jgi:hypothetical protein
MLLGAPAVGNAALVSALSATAPSRPVLAPTAPPGPVAAVSPAGPGVVGPVAAASPAGPGVAGPDAGPYAAAGPGVPAAGGATPAAARPKADEDPKFAALKRDVHVKKRSVAGSHPPARHEAGAAQAAARPPADDKVAQGKAANAEKMDAAQPKEFDKAAFIKAVQEAIAKQAPQNLEQADQFGDSDKPEQVKKDVQGRVAQGKDASAQDIATTTAAPPDTSKAVDKPVTPLSPDQPPPVPGTPDPHSAVPDQLPPAATDLSGGPRQVNQQMTDAQVTETQLANANEPSFTTALGQKHTAEQDSARATPVMRRHEATTLSAATADAKHQGTAGMHAIGAARVGTGRQVGAGKTGAQGRDEAKRAEVTAALQRVFDAAKKDVEDILSGLDGKVDEQFSREEKAARDAFTAEHKLKMAEYKAQRYSGPLGPFRWGKDKLLGLPKEADRIFTTARDHYVARMQTVISDVADTIAGELNRAKTRIAKGRTDLQAAVANLPADLKAIGQQAAQDFAGRFDELSRSVDDKGTELVQTLANKYNEALKSVDDEIAKEKEKNKGLVQKAVDAVKGVIQTILELKNLLLGVLAKAASAVMLILKDPIGFLRNLVSAVGAGLKQFLKNIVKHLEQGLVSWLLGTAAKAGLQLPAKFDVKGILLLLAGLLGLTWSAIRGRIVRKGVPDQAVTAAETAVPLVAKARREGVGGLWDDLKARIGDLKKNLFSKVIEYLVPTIIVAGITWVLSLLSPASAFIRACKLIIDIVRFVVERGRQIIDFVNAVLDAVIAIAKGAGGGVAALVENALARAIPVLIGFLASLLGVGGIADKVKKIFEALSKPVMKAVDWVIDKIVGLVKKLWSALKRSLAKLRAKVRGGDDSPEGQRRRLRAAVAAGVDAVNRFRGRPVAGKLLEPLLAAIRLRYGLTVLHPVVRGDHWVVYGRINPDLERGTGAKAEGEGPTGVNPDFTADAKDFERKLAGKAATHPAANGAMRTMARNAKEYIKASAGGKMDAWDAENVRLAELLRKIGETEVIRSGAVGTEVAHLMAVFDRGTLTERFVHIISFFTNILGSDLADATKRREVEARIAQAGLNADFLASRAPVLRRLRLAGASPRAVRRAITRAIAPVREGSEVRFQRLSRHERPASESREIGVTIAETGLRMSPREVAMHGPDWDRYRDVLKWHAGSKSWVINERSRWVQAKRKLGLPLGAGPSGTTNTMMSAAVALNGEKYATRLACIAFLVGAQHHTLVEVMVAAAPFGCDYTPGEKMYRDVKPLSEATLRSCGKDGRFPDEPSRGGTK